MTDTDAIALVRKVFGRGVRVVTWCEPEPPDRTAVTWVEFVRPVRRGSRRRP